MPKLPWDYHPDLSLDRLQLIAKILRDTRDSTVLLHDPGGGDTPWTLGCRAYGRCAEMLRRAAGTTCAWMRIVSPALEFVFTVGQVPVRFFRGDSSNPDSQHLRVSDAEAYQYGLAFGDNAVDLRWRLVVEANAAGETQRVVLIGSTDGGSVECKYVIPSLSDVTFIEPARDQVRRPVQLPPPVVRLRRDRHSKSDDEEGSDL